MKVNKFIYAIKNSFKVPGGGERGKQGFNFQQAKLFTYTVDWIIASVLIMLTFTGTVYWLSMQQASLIANV